MMQDLIVCRGCGLLSVAEDLPGDIEDERNISDTELFRREHAGHEVEVAIRCATPAVFDGPIWDPMVTSWFEVRIGTETFLVRSSRTSIEEPRRRELCRGAIERGLPSIEIDEDYLLLALDRWFFPHVLAPRRCDQFAAILRDMLAGLDADELDTSFDDADDPEIGIAPFPEALVAGLEQRAQPLFDPVEQDRLARFIAAHRGEDGALALRVRRRLLVRAA